MCSSNRCLGSIKQIHRNCAEQQQDVRSSMLGVAKATLSTNYRLTFGSRCVRGERGFAQPVERGQRLEV